MDDAALMEIEDGFQHVFCPAKNFCLGRDADSF